VFINKILLELVTESRFCKSKCV